MTTQLFDFRHYSRDDLLQALELVDEAAYPERARCILATLEQRFGFSERDLLGRYDDREPGVFGNLLGLVLFPIFSDPEPSRTQMADKITRIRQSSTSDSTATGP